MTAADNLASNIEKVAYNTYYPTEKIVKNFVGSFNYTTDTIIRNLTFAGFPSPISVYRFVHGYTRPLFVELFWSLDNSSYYLGGAANDDTGKYITAYSDSTYIYIQPTPLSANQIVYYKIVCSWIDDYDTTNPTVAPFSDLPANYTQVFNSRNSIPSIVQQGSITASSSSAFYTDITSLVPHNLGYAPNMKVYIESMPGEVWPLNYGGTSNPYLVDDNQVEAQAFTSNTDLILNPLMKSGNGTRKFWYMLYAKRSDFLTATYGATQSVI